MTVLQNLIFEQDKAPVIVKLASGQNYTALTIQWALPQRDWAAPTGVMLEIQDPTSGAPVGQRLRVFVPWNNIQFITQVIPIPDPGM